MAWRRRRGAWRHERAWRVVKATSAVLAVYVKHRALSSLQPLKLQKATWLCLQRCAAAACLACDCRLLHTYHRNCRSASNLPTWPSAEKHLSTDLVPCLAT
jgi:hypothetical protein